MSEETSITAVEKLGEVKEWLAYDIPRKIIGEAWGGKYRGQKQKWYALRFTGDDSEINISQPGGGHHKPEFIDWRWVELKSLPDLVVPFKRQTYEQVVAAFEKFAAWAAMAAGVNAGAVLPVVHERYPLADVATALEALAQDRHVGKLVVIP